VSDIADFLASPNRSPRSALADAGKSFPDPNCPAVLLPIVRA
jgi:hypothetical protein